MATVAYILLGFIGVIGLVVIILGVVSRHRSIPCQVWLGWLVELDNPFVKINRAAVIVEHLDIQPGMAVLDAGCGPGRLTIPIARQVGQRGEVVAMDVQPGMLQRTREKARAANLTNIQFLQAGLGEGKLGRDRFDRSLLVTVWGETPDRQAALREIFDALKPGGILSVTEIIFDPHFQTRQTVARLARSVGFREKALFGTRVAFTLNLEKPRHSADRSIAANPGSGTS
jgi:ubiquinone/menaquinone biosynthesis C-methylase UbiE